VVALTYVTEVGESVVVTTSWVCSPVEESTRNSCSSLEVSLEVATEGTDVGIWSQVTRVVPEGGAPHEDVLNCGGFESSSDVKDPPPLLLWINAWVELAQAESMLRHRLNVTVLFLLAGESELHYYCTLLHETTPYWS